MEGQMLLKGLYGETIDLYKCDCCGEILPTYRQCFCSMNESTQYEEETQGCLYKNIAPYKWTIDHVKEWLQENGFGDYIEKFSGELEAL
eukprot:Seg8759.2 transcript_id=Seg8759.2/GoldUCD/mRNA.D3Y31 product="hypothetical protein" pseudo=true protein_id=Seg8759.2/GoldUCD/D3Y31